MLNRLRRLRAERFPFAAEGITVTPAQLTMLEHIAALPGCSMRALAGVLSLTPPTVSVGVRRLEQLGLLERRPDPGDRRVVRLYLTPRGETLWREASRFRRDKARRLLAGLTMEEQEMLLDLLERAISAAEATESNSPPVGQNSHEEV